MRNKPAIIVIAVLFSALFMTAGLNATEQYGTFIIGGKAWLAMWDSAINRLMERDEKIRTIYNLSYLPIVETYIPKKNSFGVLGGPVLGYQTPDKKWNFSIAVMWFSYFETKATSYSLATIPTSFPVFPMSYRFEFERREVDFAPSYSINQYWKVFLGYKFQWAKIKGDRYIEMMTHSIAPGAGFYYPLGEYFVLGIQGGLLCVIPQQSKKENKYMQLFYGNTPEARSAEKVNFGINAEASISALLAGHIVLQLGYRAQVVWVDLVGKYTKAHTNDLFHGVTITAGVSF